MAQTAREMFPGGSGKSDEQIKGTFAVLSTHKVHFMQQLSVNTNERV